MNLNFKDVGNKINEFADKFTNYGQARLVPNAKNEPILKVKFGEY